MPPRKPPTAKSSKAAVKKGLAPKGKAGPASSLQKQKGLLGKLRAPSAPLGDPGAMGAPSFMPPPRPMNMPNMGLGHDSNKRNPKGTGMAGVGPKGKPR